MRMPAERRFDSYSEYRASLREALGIATRTIAIFDPDLRETGIENPGSIAAVEALCRTSPRADAVRLLVRSVDFAQRDCPRLVRLLATFGHRARLRLASPSSRPWPRPFLVADDRHLVARFVEDRPRGKLALDDLRSVTPFLAQFETMWISAEETTIGVPLGI